MTVSIVRCGINLKATISNSLKLIDFKLAKEKVFIKPNLVVPAKPDSGIITNPDVVVSLAEVLREEYGTGEIIVGEGPQMGCSIEECFEVSRYREIAEKHDLRLIDLYDARRISVSWEYGLLEIPEIIQNCCYVNIPKIKTHSQTTVTLSLKNQKGLLSVLDKKNFHKLGLHEPIAELYRAVKPDLVVVDGLIGLEGDGPIFGGKRRRLDLIVAGTNALEVDKVCCGIMGISPDEVKHLKIASGFSGKSMQPEIRGLQIDSLNIRPFKRANENLRKIGKVHYWRNASACTMCSESLNQAINEVKGNPFLMMRYGTHILYHILFKRLDFLIGKDAEIPQNHGEICCIGNCVAPLAKRYNLRSACGCPPKPRDILNKL